MEETTCPFDDTPCGTHAGYLRRTRKKQPTCEICRASHAEYVRVRRYIKKFNQERENQ